MEQLSDEELIEAFRAGNERPSSEPHLNELFSRYHQRVACWCLRFTGQRESAADLAQEIFVSAYRSLGSFRGESKFSTWLYSIARNHCVNRMRELAARPAAADFVLEEIPDKRESDPYSRLEADGSRRLLRRLMEESLDEIEKRVLTLHYLEELSLDTVTRLLGLANASGAKAYVVSARRKLEQAARRWKARQRDHGVEAYGRPVSG